MTRPMPTSDERLSDEELRWYHALIKGHPRNLVDGGEGSSLERALAELRQRRAASERRFPIMGGPSVPWRMVAPYAAQARANHDQTLERLAERGGLDPGELWAIVHGRRWRDAPPHPDACAWLDAWLAADDERTRRAERAESRARDLEEALRDAINSAEVLSAPAGTHGYEVLKVAEELLANARSVLEGAS